MRTTRRFRRPARGFTLVEAILVFAILGLLAAIVNAPFRRLLDAQKIHKVREELHAIAEALESYWYENHTGTADVTYGYFPTTIRQTDSEWSPHLAWKEGEEDAVLDEFAVNTGYRYSVSGTPKVATVYSIGPNRTDNGGAEDDISITVSSERIGRILTRKKLRDIGRAAIEYIMANKYTSTTDAWSLSAISSFGRDAWYNVDGWGNSWVIDDDYYRIYSKGPDGADDTADDNLTLQDDDIGW